MIYFCVYHITSYRIHSIYFILMLGNIFVHLFKNISNFIIKYIIQVEIIINDSEIKTSSLENASNST